MGYAIMRFKKIKSIVTLNGIQRHNERRVPIKTLTNPQNENINIMTNEIKNNCYGKTFSKILKEKLGDNKPRRNSVLAMEFIFAYTPGCIKTENIKDWSVASAKWLIDQFGESNVISILQHNDEGNPHIHAVVLPILNNSLNCKHYVNGPAACRAMQDSYYEAVKGYGDLQRGINSKITHKVHESHLRWIADNAQKADELEMYKTTYGPLEKNISFKSEDYMQNEIAI